MWTKLSVTGLLRGGTEKHCGPRQESRFGCDLNNVQLSFGSSIYTTYIDFKNFANYTDFRYSIF